MVVSGLGTGSGGAAPLLAILACIGATVCYGLSGIYINLRTKDIEPKAMAAASQLLAGIAIMPALFLSGPRAAAFTPAVAGVTVLFAILCSALAYLIYYRLMAKVGPTKALTVTFLMPVFGFLWGALFLGETISLRMILGALVILGGTLLVVSPKR